MLLFAGFALLAAAAFLVGEAATLPARQRRSSVKRAANYGRIRLLAGPPQLKFKDRVVAPASESLASAVLRLNPKMTVENVRLRLLAAGLSDRISPKGFLALKGGCAIGGVLLGALIGGSGSAMLGIALAASFAAMGFVLPGVMLSA